MSDSLWPLDLLFKVPATYPADVPAEPGVEALYFDGLPFRGKPTRVFAWYGAPSVPVEGPAPGMVLVHGGGGTAFAEWVRLWNSRGYSAIAMDLCGKVPTGEYNNWQPHEWAGPSGISSPGRGVFEQLDEDPEDFWVYHAVAAVVRAHSLLGAMPGIDGDRIGVTGLSWGGFTTCIAAGVDHRFRFAVPVYGCGFIDEMPVWKPDFENMGSNNHGKWNALWDPKLYLPQAELPMLWVTGTNDMAYPLPLLQRSYRLSPAPRTLCVRMRMPHAHGGAGENPEEIRVFANSIVSNGVPLAQIVTQSLDNGVLSATYASSTPVASAELLYTLGSGDDWEGREWESLPAEVDDAARTVCARIPDGTTAAFLNLIDERECVVSTEHVVIASGRQATDG